MTFHIITIFPHIFDSYFNESIIKRAQEKDLIKIKAHDLREWSTDRHRSVDDSPYGGGAGMVMKIEPIYKAIMSFRAQRGIPSQARFTRDSSVASLPQNDKIKNNNSKIILLSAKGKTWNQQLARKYAKLDNIILICGRYEGVDERVKKFVDEEISIGDYVLTGGEIAAMAIVDSITRLLPGALGNSQSAKDESHSVPRQLEHPQYTRPKIFQANNKKYRVPKVLLSGNHKKIEEWRKKKSKYQP